MKGGLGMARTMFAINLANHRQQSAVESPIRGKIVGNLRAMLIINVINQSFESIILYYIIL
jgi:hypothetical protein